MNTKIMGLGFWMILAACITGWTSPSGAAEPKPSPDQIIEMLTAGNMRFISGAAAHPHTDTARLTLAGKENQGDYALATVLACSDSRVPVEHIFDVGVMDIFVVRVAGNVCNVDEIGSIEYGLGHVTTPVLVILGHTQCGAVTAVTHAAEGKGHAMERNIPPLVAGIRPALDRAIAEHPDAHGDDLIPYATEENVWQAIENLFFASPSTRTFVHDGKVKVMGAMYDVATGRVRWLQESKIADILKRVETNPNRPTEPMAKEEHTSDSSPKPHH